MNSTVQRETDRVNGIHPHVTIGNLHRDANYERQIPGNIRVENHVTYPCMLHTHVVLRKDFHFDECTDMVNARRV